MLEMFIKCQTSLVYIERIDISSFIVQKKYTLFVNRINNNISIINKNSNNISAANDRELYCFVVYANFFSNLFHGGRMFGRLAEYFRMGLTAFEQW